MKRKKLITFTILGLSAVIVVLVNQDQLIPGTGIKGLPANTPTTSDSLFLTSLTTAHSAIDFLQTVPIGLPFTDTPAISHVSAVDLDGDGLTDVVVCDVKQNTVSWIRQYPMATYTETIIAEDLVAPAHAQVVDVDKDGDLDIVVAVLGMLYPNNDKIGSVVILENNGKLRFKKHQVADKIARVTDVRAGDLDGDGDLDLAVAQFGYNDGETCWMENKGNMQFESHLLQQLSGAMNVLLSDIDKDGDLDIISLVSQNWEEVYVFVNNGKGQFKQTLLWGSNNEDFGSSSIYMADVDQDGDEDILYTNGDSFNYTEVAPRPWHGLQWLENKGDGNFVFRKLCYFTGAYNCRPADIDNDGDLDLFIVSAFNVWEKAEAHSFTWLENTGFMQFVQRPVVNAPTHLVTMDTGDFNKDGRMDFVTGGLHIYPPYDRMGRVTLLINTGELDKK